ncbi:MAG: hypothetical protein V4475_01875 [Pseudomonadota bacterium]
MNARPGRAAALLEITALAIAFGMIAGAIAMGFLAPADLATRPVVRGGDTTARA